MQTSRRCLSKRKVVTTSLAMTRNQNGPAPCESQPFDLTGRDGVIRTLDPLHPMQVRYQAALRPD